MINTNALNSLGNNWDIIKANTKEISKEQLAALKQIVNKNNVNSNLENAISQLDGYSTTAADSIKQFSADNGFTYMGEIGEKYARLGFDKNVKNSVFVDLGLASNQAITTNYIKFLPAWTRGNSLASCQQYAVTGEVCGYPIMMFVDRVVVAYGGSSGNTKPTFSYRGVIVIQLHKLFPQIVLDSNKNDKYLLKTNSAAIDKSQKINLEANFSQYYDFYAPKGINANSLTVLAPNFMQMLINSSATFDVEFFGDKMYIITQDALFTAGIMEDVINALEEQLKYMQRLETSWDYQPLVAPFDVLIQSKIANFYSIKVGTRRIGLLQLILLLFLIVFLLMTVVPLIFMVLALIFSQN